MNEQEAPVLTWLRDPNGTVWAIDAAGVMTKAPDAEPVRDADWDEMFGFIPADTMAAASAYFQWHAAPILRAVLDALPLIRLWQQRAQSRTVTRRKQRRSW